MIYIIIYLLYNTIMDININTNINTNIRIVIAITIGIGIGIITILYFYYKNKKNDTKEIKPKLCINCKYFIKDTFCFVIYLCY